MADTETKFAAKIGWDMPEAGRNQRFAIAIDHGKVVYAERETSREIKVCQHSSLLASQGLLTRPTGVCCRGRAVQAVKSKWT
jgi:peroxiredoxin